MRDHRNRRLAGAWGLLARLRRDVRGNTLAIVAASMVPIAGMIGSGLDMSRAYLAKAKMQTACDAGALAARRIMAGTAFSAEAQAEGERFFEFNFPEDTMDARDFELEVSQSTTDATTVRVVASAAIPTTIMAMFGTEEMHISVECEADQDFGNNDIMLVLDVTGSMLCDPGETGTCTEGPDSKGNRLRDGAIGLYRALADVPNSRTRYGIVPYSGAVNVGRSLRTRDILRETFYQRRICWGSSCWFGLVGVHIDSTGWAGNSTAARIDSWRTSGRACIEERPTIGNAVHPIVVSTAVSQADIDTIAANDTDRARQWGRYDPGQEEGESQSACPAEATRLATYDSEGAFQTAINTATASLNGGTYHDIGLIWGARFLSSTGMFAADNPETFNDVDVNKHLVFMTDGMIDTSGYYYSSYGQQSRDNRLQGGGNQNARHIARFQSACDRAKAMGMTVWVIALDVGSTTDIQPCATSAGHFFVSDGSDLEDVFEAIGQGIARLRLTQ